MNETELAPVAGVAWPATDSGGTAGHGATTVMDPVDAAVAAREHLATRTSPDVRADDPWAEAGRKVLHFHLARMLARVPGVVAGEDPEEVHAMRVAARRMRAAWRVFDDGFERAAVRRYRTELRSVGVRLGTVRDMDVLIAMLVGYGERHGARQRVRLEPLLQAWGDERAARHRELTATLHAGPFTAFVRDYEAFALTPGLAALAMPPHAPAQVRNRMPVAIWSAYQDVWAFDRHLGGADLATLHELRIAAKWLRYTLEFVREPLDPEASALIRPVVALQDHLGDQHDRHVASVLAAQFAASAHLTDGQGKAVARLIADLDAGVDRLGRTLDRAWSPIVAPSYRRALGRAIARL